MLKRYLKRYSTSWSCVHAKALQSHPALCDPMDCGLPGSSVHWILQARILEWVAISSSNHDHEGNANQNYNEASPHSCQNGCHQKDKKLQVLVRMRGKKGTLLMETWIGGAIVEISMDVCGLEDSILRCNSLPIDLQLRCNHNKIPSRIFWTTWHIGSSYIDTLRWYLLKFVSYCFSRFLRWPIRSSTRDLKVL